MVEEKYFEKEKCKNFNKLKFLKDGSEIWGKCAVKI